MSRLVWDLKRDKKTLTLVITHIDQMFIESYYLSKNRLKRWEHSFYFDFWDLSSRMSNFSPYTGKPYNSFNPFVCIGLLSWRDQRYDTIISNYHFMRKDVTEFENDDAAIYFENILRKSMTEAEMFANSFSLAPVEDIGSEQEWKEYNHLRRKEYIEQCKIYGVNLNLDTVF